MEDEGNIQAGAEDAARNAQAADDAANAAAADPKTFSPEYVRDLRQEAARWRVEAQQYRQPWEGVTDDDQKVWREMIRLTQSDPKAGAQYMQDIAKFLSGEGQQAAPQGQPTSFTQRDIERMVEERVARSDQSRIVEEINREAAQLGYKPGTVDYVELLYVAEHETQTDLKAAHKAIQDRRAEWVESEIDRRRAEMNGWPVTTRGGTPPAPTESSIKTFEDARASMNARLDRMGGF